MERQNMFSRGGKIKVQKSRPQVVLASIATIHKEIILEFKMYFWTLNQNLLLDKWKFLRDECENLCRKIYAENNFFSVF